MHAPIVKLLYINTVTIPVFINLINYGNAISVNIQKLNHQNNNVSFVNVREKCSNTSIKINLLIYIAHFQAIWSF